MTDKETFDYGDSEKFYHNLDKFILASLKRFSKTGSLTNEELRDWFAGRIESAVVEQNHRNRQL